MNIAFIEPKSEMEGFSFGWFNRMMMLGPINLGTILHNKGHNVKVFKENVLTPNYDKLDVDILGIYSMASTAKRGYKIAKRMREKNPKIKIMIGGPHASFMTKEAKKYADVVFSGESETIINEVVNNGCKSQIVKPGICADMDKIPPNNFSLMQGYKKKLDPMPIQTSRGCPFDCNFCSVTQMFGKKYRVRNTELVIKDMMANKYKRMFIYDDNFCAQKPRAKEIVRKMKEHGLTKPWMAQTRLDVADDPELLKLMSDTNCSMLSIGLESINEKTLKWYHKSQTTTNLKKNIKKLEDHGIRVHGMFVLGSDEDDAASIKKTIEFCDDAEISYPSATALTPLPGTALFNDFDKQGRIITKDWDLYDFSHVVIKPKHLPAHKLQELVFKFSQDLFWMRKRGFRLWFEQYPHWGSCIKIALKWAKQNREYAEHLSKVN